MTLEAGTGVGLSVQRYRVFPGKSRGAEDRNNQCQNGPTKLHNYLRPWVMQAPCRVTAKRQEMGNLLDWMDFLEMTVLS